MQWSRETLTVQPDATTYTKYLRMKLGSTAVSDLTAPPVTIAGDELDIGVLMDEDTYGTGVPLTLRPFNVQGTTPMVASGAISAWAVVYAAANGKVASTGTRKIGIALTAASGDGSYIEVLRDTRSA